MAQSKNTPTPTLGEAVSMMAERYKVTEPTKAD